MSIFVALLLILASFYLLAIITDGFFVPAIDKISKKLKLSSDAAGATLLAAGSSAPEFFISLIAVLGLAGGDHADVGAGAIVGSAIFNVLVIIGIAASFKAVTLQWKPVARDQGFYIITILLLLWSFSDGQIKIHEAIIFVITYFLYVFSATNWRKWFKYKNVIAEENQEENVQHPLIELSHNFMSYLIPRPDKKGGWYWVTFALSIVFIGVLSYVLVDQVVVLADAFSINPTFLALTVLAAGTSVPDLIGSVIVAKQGRGDMAVGNAIGSNIFDVLFGLGVPWLIFFLAHPGETIKVGTENLTSSVILLFATVVSIVFLLILRRWHIGRKSGLVLVGAYVAYVIYIMLTVA